MKRPPRNPQHESREAPAMTVDAPVTTRDLRGENGLLSDGRVVIIVGVWVDELEVIAFGAAPMHVMERFRVPIEDVEFKRPDPPQ